MFALHDVRTVAIIAGDARNDDSLAIDFYLYAFAGIVKIEAPTIAYGVISIISYCC